MPKKAMLTVAEASVPLRMSTWSLYAAVRDGTSPVAPVRLGVRRIGFPTAGIAAVLGITPDEVLELVDEAAAADDAAVG